MSCFSSSVFHRFFQVFSGPIAMSSLREAREDVSRRRMILATWQLMVIGWGYHGIYDGYVYIYMYSIYSICTSVCDCICIYIYIYKVHKIIVH